MKGLKFRTREMTLEKAAGTVAGTDVTIERPNGTKASRAERSRERERERNKGKTRSRWLVSLSSSVIAPSSCGPFNATTIEEFFKNFILPSFPSVTSLQRKFRSVLPAFTGFYLFFYRVPVFYWGLLGFIGLYLVFSDFGGFYWVLLGFTGFAWVSPSLTWSWIWFSFEKRSQRKWKQGSDMNSTCKLMKSKKFRP